MKNRIFSMIVAAITTCMAAGILYFVISLAYCKRTANESAESLWKSLSTQFFEAYMNREMSETVRSQRLAQVCQEARDRLCSIHFYLQQEGKFGDIEIISWPEEGDVAVSAISRRDYKQDLTFTDSLSGSLSASFVTLSAVEIFTSARIAFLIILVGTLWAVILLIYISAGSGEESASYAAEQIDLDDYGSDDSKEEPEPEFQKEEESENQPEVEDEPEVNFGLEGDDDITEEGVSLDDEFFDKKSDEEIFGAEASADDGLPAEEDSAVSDEDFQEGSGEGGSSEGDSAGDEISNPMLSKEESASAGLPDGYFEADRNYAEPVPAETLRKGGDDSVSATTGLYTEQVLIPRLDSELVRSASSSKELALLMIQVEGIRHDSPFAKTVAARLLDTFTFRDMIFECKDDCYAVIVQSSEGIDSALSTAENLYAELNSALANMVGTGTKISIGISSRAMRMIPGSRLYTEAEQAMLHAREDRESPIVAFRVDPEKYRNFLSSN